MTISQKAGVDGRLFGSVTNADIAEALTKAGTAIVKPRCACPMAKSRRWASSLIQIAAHTDVVVDVTIHAVPEAE